MGRVQTQAQQWVFAVVGDDVRSARYLVTYKGTDLNSSEAPHVAFSWKDLPPSALFMFTISASKLISRAI